MPREADVYLEDILTAIRRIEEFTRGMDRNAFLRDARTIDAVLHNVEIIGEAAKQVPTALRTRAPEIEWRKIAALRDLIAQAHSDVDPEIVWDFVTTKLVPLEVAALRLRGEIGKG